MNASTYLPIEVDAASLVFGPSSQELAAMMPAYADIPMEFRNGSGKWNRFRQDWFFSGIDTSGLKPRDGIDKQIAVRHLAAIQSSFAPKHEHKEAAVAYLASQWFTDDSTWTKADK